MLWLALGVGLAVPGAAHGSSCPPLTLADRTRNHDVIFTAQALPGETDPGGTLLSPARFRVTRRDKGTGPEIERVTTAVSRYTGPDGRESYATATGGLFARPGVTYRIFGVRSSDGVMSTGACSRSAPAQATGPATVQAGRGKRRRLPLTDVVGGPQGGGRLPCVAAGPGDVVSLRGLRGEIAVTDVGSTQPFGTLTSSSRGSRLRLPRDRSAAPGRRVVVQTQNAFYAFVLARRR